MVGGVSLFSAFLYPFLFSLDSHSPIFGTLSGVTQIILHFSFTLSRWSLDSFRGIC